MKKNWPLIVLLLLLSACDSNEENKDKKEEPYFPVLSYIKSQVGSVDTSLFTIRKITILDSLHSDTAYVKREDFRGLAKDFLDIPDLAEKKMRKRFKEENMFDQTINRAVISYTPIDPEKEEIQKQQVLITPNAAIGDKVNSIIIERSINNKDSSVQKNMIWQVDQSFQVTTVSQKPGQPEVISTMKVTWNEKEEQ